MITFKTVIIVRDHADKDDLIGKALREQTDLPHTNGQSLPKSLTVDMTAHPKVVLTWRETPTLECDAKLAERLQSKTLSLAFSTLSVSDLTNLADHVFIVQGAYFRIIYPVLELTHNSFHRRFIQFQRSPARDTLRAVEAKNLNTNEETTGLLFVDPEIWGGNPDDIAAIYRQNRLSSSALGVLPPFRANWEGTYFAESYTGLRSAVARRLRQASPQGSVPSLVRMIDLYSEPLIYDFLGEGGSLQVISDGVLPSQLLLTTISDDSISHWRANLLGLPGDQVALGPQPWFKEVIKAVRSDLKEIAEPDELDFNESVERSITNWNVRTNELEVPASGESQRILEGLFAKGTPDYDLLSRTILEPAKVSNVSPEQRFLDCMLGYSPQNPDSPDRIALWRLVTDVAMNGVVTSPEDRFPEPDFRITKANGGLILTHRRHESMSSRMIWTLQLPLRSIVRRATINVLDDSDARLGPDFILD